MRLESMVRLVESADVASFRELALIYLKEGGAEGIELRDGPGDGGNDVTLWRLGANPTPVALQISIQRKDWQGKLRQDAAKAKARFGFTHFHYITSRRISATASQPITDELWSRENISLRVIDSQSIASAFFERGASSELLKTLGIRLGGDELRDAPGTSLKQELAYSYAFFGADVDDFRQTSLERSILAYLTREKEPPTRPTVVTAVVKVLGIKKSSAKIVETQIDRMLQRGELQFVGGGLAASTKLLDAHRAARSLRASQWKTLSGEIEKTLGDAGLRGSNLETATQVAIESSGGLMLSSAEVVNAGLEADGDEGPARARMRTQLRRLEKTISDAGIEPDEAAHLVVQLTTVISKSPLGQNILAGGLFISLLQMDVEHLLQALGDHDGLQVFLDASVAIPMLASALYEPHDRHFFRGASYIYDQAKCHGITLKLPRDYLEEVASHLLEAFDRYLPLIDRGADLRYSQNAFVAHYATLSHEGKYDGNFVDYVGTFGLRVTERQDRDFATERDWIMSRMRTLYARYGIVIEEHGEIPRQALRAAREAIAYTARELEIERPDRLLEHDRRAVADISARAAAGSTAIIFCTWDRLHLRLRTAGGPVDWRALTPSTLGDLLALVAPRGSDGAAGAALDIALELGDEDARRGAEIWDELVRIEQGRLYDADLLARAEAFKDSYMTRVRLEDVPIATAWKEARNKDEGTQDSSAIAADAK